MAKRIKGFVKLQLPAGKATMAPPVGPALGPYGVNGAMFVKQFNDKTKKDEGMIIPVVITIYEDRSFTFITKTPPASNLIKKFIKLEKGSGEPNRRKVGKISRGDLEEIAKIKDPDLTAANIDNAVSIIAGTARSMGVEVKK